MAQLLFLFLAETYCPGRTIGCCGPTLTREAPIARNSEAERIFATILPTFACLADWVLGDRAYAVHVEMARKKKLHLVVCGIPRGGMSTQGTRRSPCCSGVVSSGLSGQQRKLHRRHSLGARHRALGRWRLQLGSDHDVVLCSNKLLAYLPACTPNALLCIAAVCFWLPICLRCCRRIANGMLRRQMRGRPAVHLHPSSFISGKSLRAAQFWRSAHRVPRGCALQRTNAVWQSQRTSPPACVLVCAITFSASRTDPTRPG